MVKVMYNDKFVYKVVIWAFFGISLWKEKVALMWSLPYNLFKYDGTCLDMWIAYTMFGMSTQTIHLHGILALIIKRQLWIMCLHNYFHCHCFHNIIQINILKKSEFIL